tara:strand:+ start:1802 stop:2785 length:984 start_codon:yes stop_codon:yes gene_type:complete
MTTLSNPATALSALPLRTNGKEERTFFNEKGFEGGGFRGTPLTAKKMRLFGKKTHRHFHFHHHRCLDGWVCVSSSAAAASSAKAHLHQKCCSSMTTSFGIFGGDKGRRNSRKTRFLKNKRAGVASNKHNAIALNAAASLIANNNNIISMAPLFNNHGLGVNELAWLLSTLYALFCFSICVRAKRGDEKAIANIRNYSTLVPLAVFYGVLLIRSWSDNTLALMMPGSLEEGLRTGEVQFIPKLSGISELLSEKAASASAWAHFMLVNLFVARHATLQSLKFDLPVAHTLALCLVTGPLGLLSHVVTKWIVLKLRSKRSSSERSAENER